MKKAAFIAIGFLLGMSLSAQTIISDTLKEVLVTEKALQPVKLFKNQVIFPDSLPSLFYHDLAELLRQETGVFVRSYGSNGVASLSFRGTGAAHTDLYWNGLKLTSPTVGQADFSMVPVSSVDKVEVRYGLASLTDGSGGLGGSISLNAQADWDNRLSISIEQEVASFGAFNSLVEVTAGKQRFQSTTKIFYSLAENNFPYPDITKTGYPEAILSNASYLQKGFFQNFFYRLKDNHELSLKAWYSDLFREIPAPITGNSLKRETMSDEMFNAVGSWKRAGRKNLFQVSTGISVLDNYFKSPEDSIDSPIFYTSWQNRIIYQHWFSGPNMKLEAGWNTTFNSVSSNGFVKPVKQWRSGGFVNLGKKFGENAGAELLLREEMVDGEWSPVLGSLGGYYDAGKFGTFKMNIARNYRYPSLNDLYWSPGGNPDLLPENSWGFEAGYLWDFQIKKMWFEVGLTAFHNEVDNWILWVPGGNHWYPQNVKKVLNKGVETQLKMKWEWRDLNVSGQAEHTFIDSRNKAFYVANEAGLDKQLIFVPHHKLNGSLRLTYRSFLVAYNQYFSGRYFISTDNLFYMPAYSVADVSLGYEFVWGAQSRHSIKTAIAVKNLYNWPYQVMPYRPEPGRHFGIKINYQFEK